MRTLKPLGNNIILINLDHGERKTASGIIILDDSTTDAGERGIRARWAEVYAVGPEQTDVNVGQWVLMDHGRWSVGQTLDLGETEIKFWLGDPNGILGVSDSKPAEVK